MNNAIRLAKCQTKLDPKPPDPKISRWVKVKNWVMRRVEKIKNLVYRN